MLSRQTLLRAMKNICYSAYWDKENDVFYARLFSESTIFDFRNLKTYHYMLGWRQVDNEENIYKRVLETIHHWYRGCHCNTLDDLSKPMKKELQKYGIM
jgi:hypothetical protein